MEGGTGGTSTSTNAAGGLEAPGINDYNSRLSMAGKWRIYDGDTAPEKLVNVSAP